MSELIEFYADLTRLPARVVGAFLAEGIEPPDRETVDRRGYSSREMKMIEKHYAATRQPDPFD